MEESENKPHINRVPLNDGLERILPCPFCGCSDIRVVKHFCAGDTVLHRRDNVFSIGCYACGGSVPNRYIRNLVIESWNKRSNVKLTGSLLNESEN